MSGHRGGGKFAGSHSTIIHAAEAPADAAAKLAAVSKISLGRIARVKGSEMRLKFKETLAGWEVTVYGRNVIQKIQIYTTDRETTRATMEKAFSE